MEQDGKGSEVDLSIVIPVYNEQQNVIPLVEGITKVVEKLSLVYEIVFIDDGSTDGTFNQLRDNLFSLPGVSVIKLRRNFGKAAALMEGFRRSGGQVVITMDGDMQDDPAEIPHFLDKINDGYDIVSGWKKQRKDPPSKTIPSRIFNRVTSFFAGIRLHDFNCGFKAYRREVIENLVVYGELYRFIPVIAHWQGFKVGEMGVTHHPRTHGKSKFGAGRFIKGFVDFLTVLFLTKYAKRPLHFLGSIGLAFFTMGTVIELYLTYLWFFSDQGIGWRPILFLGILLIIVGIQIIMTGLIGELIYNVHSHSEQVHYVREIHGEGRQGGQRN
ncbi:glycosyltransferase family 2 protein [Acidobacteriota bacterium]